MKTDGWDGDENIDKIQWTFPGALFYSIIVITTIGKLSFQFFKIYLFLQFYPFFNFLNKYSKKYLILKSQFGKHFRTCHLQN